MIKIEQRKVVTIIKKIALLLVVFSVCYLITACTYTEENSAVGLEMLGGTLKCVSGDRYCTEWVDTETGVHYFMTYEGGGLTVRVMPDGTPYIDAKESKGESDHE